MPENYSFFLRQISVNLNLETFYFLSVVFIIFYYLKKKSKLVNIDR